MRSSAPGIVALLALCGTLGCSAGSPATPPASPSPPAASGPSEGALAYPEPPGLESLSSMEELEKAPTFTPFTVRPDIKNREWVARMLRQEYPPLLREQGIGGKAWIWLFMDAAGEVRRIILKESTGNLQLDQAALRVAAFMEFTPAYNKDKPVPVWISVPVTFSVKK